MEKRMPTDKNADPNLWGPPLWDLLFTFAFKIPPQEQHGIFRDLFRELERVLPCQHCRRSYAMYRHQVAPLSSLKDPTTNPAQWLWTIHDMVNQNIGKTCISYDKLENKHAAFTCLTHPLNVIDLFCIMKPIIKREHLIEFINTVLVASRLCPGMGQLPAAFLNVTQSESISSTANLTTTLFEVHNNLRQACGVCLCQDVETFWQTYNVP